MIKHIPDENLNEVSGGSVAKPLCYCAISCTCSGKSYQRTYATRAKVSAHAFV
jgi:hypothetical protein